MLSAAGRKRSGSHAPEGSSAARATATGSPRPRRIRQPSSEAVRCLRSHVPSTKSSSNGTERQVSFADRCCCPIASASPAGSCTPPPRGPPAHLRNLRKAHVKKIILNKRSKSSARSRDLHAYRRTVRSRWTSAHCPHPNPACIRDPGASNGCPGCWRHALPLPHVNLRRVECGVRQLRQVDAPPEVRSVNASPQLLIIRSEKLRRSSQKE